MARKILNRKELRAEAEAAEKKTATKKTAKKKAATPKPRAKKKKVAAEVRMKVYWGVFTQSLRRVALYEFNQKTQAEKKAAELSASAKTPHFVQRVKEAITE